MLVHAVGAAAQKRAEKDLIGDFIVANKKPGTGEQSALTPQGRRDREAVCLQATSWKNVNKSTAPQSPSMCPIFMGDGPLSSAVSGMKSLCTSVSTQRASLLGSARAAKFSNAQELEVRGRLIQELANGKAYMGLSLCEVW